MDEEKEIANKTKKRGYELVQHRIEQRFSINWQNHKIMRKKN